MRSYNKQYIYTGANFMIVLVHGHKSQHGFSMDYWQLLASVGISKKSLSICKSLCLPAFPLHTLGSLASHLSLQHVLT